MMMVAGGRWSVGSGQAATCLEKPQALPPAAATGWESGCCCSKHLTLYIIPLLHPNCSCHCIVSLMRLGLLDGFLFFLFHVNAEIAELSTDFVLSIKDLDSHRHHVDWMSQVVLSPLTQNESCSLRLSGYLLRLLVKINYLWHGGAQAGQAQCACSDLRQ